MSRFSNRNKTIQDVLEDGHVQTKVKVMAGLLERHYIQTALKLAEKELNITRADACLLVCEVAGELSAVRLNPNLSGGTYYD